MKIQSRLKTGAWLSLLLTIIMGGMLIWAYQDLTKSEEHSELVNQMRTIAFERTSLRDEYLLLNSERARKQWHIKTATLNELLAKAKRIFISPNDRTVMAEICESYESTSNIFNLIENNRKLNTGAGKQSAISRDLEQRLVSQILLKAYDLNSSIARLQLSAHDTAEDSLETLIHILAISFILLALLVIINSLFINRLMTTQLAKLRKGTDIISQGRLDFRFRLRPDDEFGIVATSIDHTLAKLQHSLTSIDDLANEIERRIVVESELKRLNRVYSVISHINQMLIKTDDRERLFEEVCNIAVEYGYFRMAWIGLVDDKEEQVKPVAWAGHEDGYLEDISISTRDIPEGRGPSGTSVREKRVVVCNDFASDPGLAPWREKALARKYLSSISLPIILSDRVLGTLTLYSSEPLFFTASEITLLSEVVHNIAFALTMLDIDEKRLQAETHLKKSEERMRLLIDATPFPVAVVDLEDNKILFWSQSAADLFGHTAPTAAEWYQIAYPDPDYRLEVIERWKTSLTIANSSHKVVNSGEYRVTCSDGSERICEIYANFIHEYLIVTFNDITERKLAEEVIQAEKMFSESLISNLPGVFYLISEEGRFLRWNKRFEAVTGRSAEEMALISPMDLFEGDDKQAIASAIERVFTHGTVNVEGRFVSRDGRRIPYQFSGDKILVHGIPSLIGVGLDITDRKKADEALNKTVAELERSNKELEQFAYIASHDLQEPLRTISSYVQLLEKRYRGRLDQDANDFINFIVDGAARMQKMINDLLEYSRVSTKARSFTVVDCNTIVQSAIANLQLKIEKADADIKYISLPVVMADSSQLLQLFQNLIANAIKFRGEKRPELRITAESTGTEFIFSVRDNGIGFDQQYAEKIFDIFKRLHTQSKYPGSGIGLAICRRIVERHGGRIWAEGIPGKGATFCFTIPQKGAE